MMYKLNFSPKKGIIVRTLSLAMLTGIALIIVAVMAACPSDTVVLVMVLLLCGPGVPERVWANTRL